MIAFGPVPSRRLGRSLGINNIPPKRCTYSCVYCQVGKTTRLQVDRTGFYDPEKIFADVQKKVEKAHNKGERIDYLTFVADGEPTLDVNLGNEIEILKSLGIKIAVITNSALIWRKDVRTDLAKADWVSLKIDSTSEKIWRRINRPHQALKPEAIWAGMLEFADGYSGTLVTETMLVKSLNEGAKNFREIANFLSQFQPAIAYVAVPTRPPAEKWVKPPDESIINEAFQILNEKPFQVEYLIGYEGNAFAFTGDVAKDLLSVTAVHPMREDAVKEFLSRAESDWSLINQLIRKNKLIKMAYNGHRFYMRVISHPRSSDGVS
jgi:wyosine [tRNA(Phe)-imidazoG37] synthetase (radical SAM superfamily)